MKRLFFTLAIAASFVMMSSFTTKDDVNPSVLESFKSSFKSATDVIWSSNQDIFKAEFVMNGQYISAFYDVTGKMIGVTRNISTVQLPVPLQTSLKNGYENFGVSDLMEYADEGGTSYYVTLENADTKMIMKSSYNTGWNLFSKQRKS
jgi:hypothetical protein